MAGRTATEEWFITGEWIVWNASKAWQGRSGIPQDA